MSISNFPTNFDTNANLYEVHDVLRLVLADDYNPGDGQVIAMGDPAIISRFPATGLITLTEQCSEPELRALTFEYTSISSATVGSTSFLTFTGQVRVGFEDVVKPKNITNVVQNVMAEHHNGLKDALIAIENFVGVKGVVSSKPLVGTMEARINFLRKLALSPKAWFSVDKTIGLIPLTTTFQDLSLRLGTDGSGGNITYEWNFGDNTISNISLISVSSVVPSTMSNVIVEDIDGGTITKTYTNPGIFDATLTVSNIFGSDSITFPGLINARYPAPDEAVVDFIPYSGQILTNGSPIGGPYTTPPKIRAAANTLIELNVNSGVNPFTAGRTYGGEVVSGNNSPIDPIVDYTWSLADDLTHPNSMSTKASFSVGGVYDMVLRTDTSFGSYRITEYLNAIDIVEQTNLWLWTISGNTIDAFEFGLISETFKSASASTYNIKLDDSFLDSAPNSAQQQKEFNRNNGFSSRGTTPSGNGGAGLLYWASGRDNAHLASTETIESVEYNGFNDTYITRPSISRSWNWVDLNSNTMTYFILGSGSSSPNTDQNEVSLDLVTLTTTQTTLSSSNYSNHADELEENVGDVSVYGNFSVYRSAWSGNNGYFLRNNGVGDFFRIQSFYKVTPAPFNIAKLPDMSGLAKTEGQLVALSAGLYFFNNSGSMAVYVPTSGTWINEKPGTNSIAFRSLQDVAVSGFDDTAQTLLAASDGDHRAYLSYDYSTNAYIKFNEADTTFSSLGSRPAGTQWQMQIF